MKLSVNGADLDVQSTSDTPLLWVLRDELQMKGTKFGCGIGECGACAVHLDGQRVRACITPLGEIAGRAVTTIEGLGASENHPVQVAWLKMSVPQCGYCQPGQIMSAAALLAANPAPSDDEISVGMEGNICRCGTYQRIRAAIHHAAELLQTTDEPEKTP